MSLFTFFTVAFHSSVMKDDGCSRKTAATIDDVNDNMKRGSAMKTNNDNKEC